ncbi:hypothetical protein HYH03_013995 [Edaphochlamys debaryana]|uniref:AAA+ ATPase domain-containing protein n=1 Tax=Edaphochlamys debaryana TaxID=47281 RepID=A0A835XNQ9_9CHLO|nr:hypothetical protein HYH03_013995 [Edaphochlamys debaryana]|eukprot:KAG2487428.1 hypothetical protein HYH03_013995 [Edaphochlamys debaryana]
MTGTRRGSSAATAAQAEAAPGSARRSSRVAAKADPTVEPVLVAIPMRKASKAAKSTKRGREELQPEPQPAPAPPPAAEEQPSKRRQCKSTATGAEPQPAPAPESKPEPACGQADATEAPAAKKTRRKSGRSSNAAAAAAAIAEAAAAELAASEAGTRESDKDPAPSEEDAGAAQACHQLEAAAAPSPAPAPAPAPAPLPALRSPTRHLLPLRSPPASPHRVLIATAAAKAAGSPARGTTLAAAAAKAAAGSPARATVPTTAPAAPPAAAAPAAAPAAAEGPLTPADITAIRRLLQPGAMAGTLMSCAAASAGGAPASAPAAAAATATAAATGTAGPAGASGSGAAGGGSAPEPAGRGAQFKELCGMVAEACSSGRGGAVYISGLPGTGKTYTVSRLLASLPSVGAASGAAFCVATVNCMTMDDPVQLYCRLQDELTAASTATSTTSTTAPSSFPSAAAAHDSLVSTLQRLSSLPPPSGGAGASAKAFKAKGSSKRGRGAADASTSAAASASDASSSGPRRRVFVVVLDEVDRLMRRREGGEELARLFQLPSAQGVPLVLLAVANSLDLTERMMPLLRARGLAPRHMVFTAYSRPQVLAILTAQLSCHPRGARVFDPAALDMVAKAVSSSSGDLRQALKACRTALDVLAEHNRAATTAAASASAAGDDPSSASAATAPAPAGRASVNIRDVHAALQRISAQGSGQPAVLGKIRGLPPQQQLVLLALATAVGARAAAASGEGSVFTGVNIFTGARPKFMDGVAFREIGNSQPAGSGANPGSCFDGPTPTKAGRGGGGAGAATPPTSTRVRGVTGPGGGGNATPGSRAHAPPSGRGGATPASILAGDAGLAMPAADVYSQYTGLCKQLDIPAMSESAFRTDALPGLDCDGLLKIQEGRTPAATRLSLRAMVKDVQAALADNVMFKRLLGASKPPPGPAAAGAGAGGIAGGAAPAVVPAVRA